MTLQEANAILNAMNPSAKKATPKKKRGKMVGKARLCKLTIRCGTGNDKISKE